jgi:hypothetical protein
VQAELFRGVEVPEFVKTDGDSDAEGDDENPRD